MSDVQPGPKLLLSSMAGNTLALTVDNLRVDHRVSVIRDFTDSAGTSMCAGESGVLRGLSWDQLRGIIHIEIEREGGAVSLVIPLSAQSGPRNGHMREFFELGDYVPVPGTERVFDNALAKPVNALSPHAAENNRAADWDRTEPTADEPDRLEEREQALLASINHIGVAASIAEMYAERMRKFQREGNQARAIAAFKLAVDWMGTYASWATSGGEGTALSYERDRFHAALVREFGSDPTKNHP